MTVKTREKVIILPDDEHGIEMLKKAIEEAWERLVERRKKRLP
jgi:hypothetical protein